MTDDINRMSTEELGHLFPIILVDYDYSWPEVYLHEKGNILKALSESPDLLVEHIGSTAIPGIYAKPTIDIMLIIPDTTNTDLLIRDLESIKYQYIPKPENPPPHIMLAKGYSTKGFTGQTFHVHVRYTGCHDEIIFRDYLLKNPDIAEQYNDLKKVLLEKHKNDREKYTDGKTEFVKQILRLASNNQ